MHITHQYYFGFQSQGLLSNWSNWLSKIFRNYVYFSSSPHCSRKLVPPSQPHAELKNQARLGNPRFFPALFLRDLKNFSFFLSFFLISLLIGWYFSFPIYLTSHCDDLSFGFTRLDWKVLPYDFHTYVWKSKRLLDIVPPSTGHSGQHFHRFLTGLRQFNSGHSINVQRILPSSHLHSGVQGPGDQRSPCSCCMPS